MEIDEMSDLNRMELQSLVKEFFEQYLDTWETSDSGIEFNPITIGCARCMKTKPLNELLNKMRTLSGAKPRYQVERYYDEQDDDE